MTEHQRIEAAVFILYIEGDSTNNQLLGFSFCNTKSKYNNVIQSRRLTDETKATSAEKKKKHNTNKFQKKKKINFLGSYERKESDAVLEAAAKIKGRKCKQ